MHLSARSHLALGSSLPLCLFFHLVVLFETIFFAYFMFYFVLFDLVQSNF